MSERWVKMRHLLHFASLLGDFRKKTLPTGKRWPADARQRCLSADDRTPTPAAPMEKLSPPALPEVLWGGSRPVVRAAVGGSSLPARPLPEPSALLARSSLGLDCPVLPSGHLSRTKRGGCADPAPLMFPQPGLPGASAALSCDNSGPR